MKQFDQEKLNIAITYVDRIAGGCNPVNNIPLEQDMVLNNPNIIRCMYFIQDVLEAVQNNGGIVSSRTAKEPALPFPEEGYLVDELNTQTGQNRKMPSEKGSELGIYVTDREFHGRAYQAVVYDRKAQEYVVEMVRGMV